MTEANLPKIDKAMFLGCLIPARLPFIEKSAKVVCKDLNIQLHPMLGAGCCPEPIGVNAVDEKTWMALASRNVTVAEDMGQTDIIAFCSGCTLTLKTANDTLKSDPHRKEEVNEYLSSINKEFKGNVATVRHVAQVIYDEVGLEQLKAMVKKPLSGLRVAMHYGCHFIRPSEIMNFEDPFYPSKVEEILRALGAETVDYTEKLLCCGQGVSSEDAEVQTDMNYRKYKSIQEAGASCICVVCPSCYQNLEGGQRNVKKKFGEKYKLPVLYLTDLVALALGHSPDEIGLKYHRPSPKNILAEIGIGNK